MDFSQLDDVLEENAYVPTFNKPRTASNPKSLLKNNSTKSIENISSSPRPIVQDKPIPNLLHIQRQTKKQVLSFQDLLKKQQEKPEVKIERRTEIAPQRKQVKQIKFDYKQPQKQAKKGKLNDSYWQDDDEDVPAVGQGRMKPPLARRNDDNRSVVSRRNDDNKSVASVAQFKKTKEENQPFNILPSPVPSPHVVVTPPTNYPTFDQTTQIRREAVQVKQINYVADTSQLKKMLQDQLALQRQLSEKMLKEQQEIHKREVEQLKKLHQEQLTRKLQLKTLQISKIKEYYEMQLKSRSERTEELKELSKANHKFDEGIKALEKAQEEFRSKGQKLEQDRQSKISQDKIFEQFANQKERYIQDLLSKLEVRQKQFRDERNRNLHELQRQKKRMEQFEARVYKKERELEQRFNKRERQLIQQYQDKQSTIKQSQTQLRLKVMETEQEKLRLQQEKQELQVRQRKWEESRIKLMEEIQTQKMKLVTKQMQVTSKSNEWWAKQSEISMKQKELSGKLKLIQLQRKRMEVERDMKKRSNVVQPKISFERHKQETGPTLLEKSIKQLKDEYLRNLGHI